MTAAMQQLMKARPLAWLDGRRMAKPVCVRAGARSAAGRRPDSYESPKAMGETSPLKDGRGRDELLFLWIAQLAM